MPSLPTSPEGIAELGDVVFELAARGIPWAGVYKAANGSPHVLAAAVRRSCEADPGEWHHRTPLTTVKGTLADALELALFAGQHLREDR